MIALAVVVGGFIRPIKPPGKSAVDVLSTMSLYSGTTVSLTPKQIVCREMEGVEFIIGLG